MQIKKFIIFSNNTKLSIELKDKVKEKLEKANFIESKKSFDLAIAIGGDGCFLRMVKETKFNSRVLYVGINTGTLGFAQEVKVDDIDNFINNLIIENYKIDNIGIQETKIITSVNTFYFNSLNEIVIRDKNLNTLTLDVMIDSVKLEKFVGDGMLVATSFGSTAYNLSFGGSIVYNTFHTLQLTPIAPLNNMSYRNLLNSVIIPEEKKIFIIPKNKDLLIQVDGDNNIYDNVSLIETYIHKKRIKCYRDKNYDFSKKINEKFLK